MFMITMVIRYRLNKSVESRLKILHPREYNLKSWGLGIMIEATTIILGFVAPYSDVVTDVTRDIQMVGSLLGGSLFVLGYFIMIVGVSAILSTRIKMVVKDEFIDEREELF